MASLIPKTAGSVKTLRQYWKDRYAEPNAEHFRKEINGESDRAVVILVATMIDDWLAHAINERAVIKANPDEMEYMFRFEGPMGSFSARIEIAYIFGVIDERTMNQVDVIREMRNACAHSKRGITFAMPVLSNVLKRILKPNGEISLLGTSGKDMRDAFISEAIIIISILQEGSREKGIMSLKEDIREFSERPPSQDKPTPQST